jgi:hypothetical protein
MLLQQGEELGDKKLWKTGGVSMLEIFDLIGLHKMVTLSCDEGVLREGILPKLHALKIKECSELRKLPLGIKKLPDLKGLYGDRTWWENIIWEDNNMNMYFHKLFIEI